MSKIKLALCCVVLIFIGNSMGSRVRRAMSSTAKAFYGNQVVPDVLPYVPDQIKSICVKYQSGVEAKEGNELTPTQVKYPPHVSWPSESTEFYTLALVDPDVPSRRVPTFRELQHWLVVNIRGDQVAGGKVLSAYLSPTPPFGAGLHRYVFVAYKQPGHLIFDEPRISNASSTMVIRVDFSIAKFAEKHNLGLPIAGNLFQAQYDYGQLLDKQLCEA